MILTLFHKKFIWVKSKNIKLQQNSKGEGFEVAVALHTHTSCDQSVWLFFRYFAVLKISFATVKHPLVKDHGNSFWSQIKINLPHPNVDDHANYINWWHFKRCFVFQRCKILRLYISSTSQWWIIRWISK